MPQNRRRFWFLALAIAAVVGAHSLSTAKVVDRIVAVVNNESLTQGDLMRLVEEHIRALQIYQRMGRDQARSIAESQMDAHLKDLIASTMLEQEARRQEREDPNLQISQVMLDEEINGFRLQNGLRSDDEFARALTEQGYTMASFRREMLRSVRIKELFKREIVPRLNVTDDEAVAFYEAHQDEFDSKGAVKIFLREQRFAEERQTYIDRLKEKTFVKVMVAF